jgi:hypothetical protein
MSFPHVLMMNVLGIQQRFKDMLFLIIQITPLLEPDPVKIRPDK